MTPNDFKYKAIFEVTPVAIWEFDFSEIKKLLLEKGLFGQSSTFVENTLKDNRNLVNDCISKLIIIDFNEACVKLSHAKSKKELKENFLKLFTPESIEIFITQLAAICQGLNSFENESKILTLDRHVKSISFKWKVVPGFEESLESVIVTTEDITFKDNVLKKHEDLEQKLTEAQKIAKVGYWELELESSRLFWSDEVYNIWGLEKSKAIFNFENFHQSIHPEDVKEFDWQNDQAIAGITPLDYKHRIITPNGEVKWVHEKGKLYNENGKKTFKGTVQDITEEEILKQGLKDLLKRYHFVTKATFEAIYDWDLESNTVVWGEGYRSIFGYQLDKFKPDYSTWKDNVHPEDLQRVLSNVETYLTSEEDNWQKEYRFRKASGEFVYVNDKSYALRDANGKVYRMVGAIQDISDQKMFEETLSQERNLLRTLIDNIPDYIFVKDTQFRQIINNKANVRLLGAKTEEETIGKTAYDYFPKEMADLYYQDDLFVLQSKKPIIEREEPIVDNDGNKRWLSTSKIPLFNAKGEGIGLVGIARDITNKKNREQSLILKTKLLQTIADAVKILLFNEDWEPAMQECLELMGKAVEADRVYLFENFLDPTTKKLYSRPLKEWVQKGISPQIGNPDYQTTALDDHPLFLELALKNEPFSFLTRELEGKTKEILDKLGIKSILLIPVYIKDHFYGYLGFEDYNQERKWNEEETSFLKTLSSNLAVAIERKNHLDSVKKLNEDLQKSNAELDISNKDLEQFAYVASHDLQEPLRMISSFLGQLEKKYSDILDEKGKQYIYFAVDGAKRMKSIILDLLEFSRVGRMEDPIFPIDLNLLMEEVKLLLKSQIVENNASIVIPQLPVVISQRSQLRQVLQNIISNAIKYRKKEIDPIITIEVKETSTNWEFIIEDNGIGISPEYFQKIFVIFQRLHNKEEYKGTGIGLAICKKIIENLGGRIWVESEENKGSRFHFTLPKKPQNLS
ncbi:PAS domain-containing protein [Aquiflexum sp.]|uniref:PAS domain-containing protein n=1 Tax=Aquiflexum sp. TaxID=1872584 RepID=UPI0035939131